MCRNGADADLLRKPKTPVKGETTLVDSILPLHVETWEDSEATPESEAAGLDYYHLPSPHDGYSFASDLHHEPAEGNPWTPHVSMSGEARGNASDAVSGLGDWATEDSVRESRPDEDQSEIREQVADNPTPSMSRVNDGTVYRRLAPRQTNRGAR